MNNKGVSIMSLVITMIVIIILAGIAMNAGTTNIDKAQKSAFLSDLERAQFELQSYCQRGLVAKELMITEDGQGGNPNFDPLNLYWDGDINNKRATDTAKMEDGVNEDTIDYIFNHSITKNLENKIFILDGTLYVKSEYQIEFEWAVENYDYMRGVEAVNPGPMVTPILNIK